jgi:LCP family protein required for cell wall assembly
MAFASFLEPVRTTLKRGIGRLAAGNGNGRAVLPPGALSPVTRYQQPEKRRGAWRTVGRIVFIVVALLVAVVAGVAGGGFIYTDENAHALAPRSVQTAKAAKSLNIPSAGQPANALLIGYDHRPSDGSAPSRSDTVMLLRADPSSNTISLLSFPRDLIVNGSCPDGRSYVGRINEAYSYCGPAGTLETVRSLTRLPLHYLITVNFQGFRDIVDKLGGVWMDVDRRYYNPHGGVYATINLWPGYQKLKGWQALDYVRYRHTDSDLFRLARQQLFVKAVKQAVNHNWTNPKTVPKLFKVMRNNVEIGQKQGEISGSTLISYAFFAYGLPAGNFVQVKIGGLTGTNELHTDQANIDAAVQEFLHPDAEAPEKATAVATGRKLRSKNGPSPKQISLVVLNGNGKPGAAANTSFMLGQKGYRVLGPPEGFQANAPGRWARTFRTQVFYTARPKARRAAEKVSALFNSSEIRPMPKRNQALQVLRNGAMLLVIVGQTFSGELTPTPVDRTPKRQAPYVRSGKADMLPVVRRAAAWKVGFPLQIPTVLERTSTLSTEVPYRVYKLDDSKTVRFTFAKSGNEYWGIQETNWQDAPALEDKNLSAVIKRRQYDLYFNGPHLHMVVLRAGGASYWVVNTLLDSMSNETMLAIAKGLRPLHK